MDSHLSVAIDIGVNHRVQKTRLIEHRGKS